VKVLWDGYRAGNPSHNSRVYCPDLSGLRQTHGRQDDRPFIIVEIHGNRGAFVALPRSSAVRLSLTEVEQLDSRGYAACGEFTQWPPVSRDRVDDPGKVDEGKSGRHSRIGKSNGSR